MHVAIDATAKTITSQTYAVRISRTRLETYSIGLREDVVQAYVPTALGRRDDAFRSQCSELAVPTVLGYFVSDWDHAYSTACCEAGGSRFDRYHWHNTYTRYYRASAQKHWDVPPKRYALAVRLTCYDPANPPASTSYTSIGFGSADAETVISLSSPHACSYQRPTRTLQRDFCRFF
jgi:hypothetical protein